MLRNKLLSLVLAFFVAFSAVAAPRVFATEKLEYGWTELLEYSSVSDKGENWFEVNGKSGSFTIPLHTEKRLAKVDITIWHQTVERISTATVTKGGTTSNLTVAYVGSNITRVFGTIPNSYYETLTVTIGKNTTSNAIFEVLSCRVTPLTATEYAAQAEIWPDGDPNRAISTPATYNDGGDGTTSTFAGQIPVVVHDWEKYDTVTVFGSLAWAGLNSVRVSIGNMGLPFEMSYTSTNATGEFTNNHISYRVEGDYYDENDYMVSGSDQSWTSYEYDGKVLYTITVDVTNIDRALGSQPLIFYFTFVQSGQTGFALNIQGVSGSVFVADTSGVSWWNQVKAFFTDLLGGDTAESDQFQEDAGEKNEELSDLNDELASVTLPPIEDIDTSFDNYVSDDDITLVGGELSQLTGDSLFSMILMMSLGVALLAYILYGKRG